MQSQTNTVGIDYSIFGKQALTAETKGPTYSVGADCLLIFCIFPPSKQSTTSARPQFSRRILSLGTRHRPNFFQAAVLVEGEGSCLGPLASMR